MKKFYSIFERLSNGKLTVLFLFFSFLFGQNVSAQVDVNATAGTLIGNYTTVKLAFDAINAGTHQGVITISLTGNTTETASAVLNSGAIGPAAYTSVGITATVPVTISGSIVGGVIKLNGADNVTIDGRIAGVGRNITVQNTSTAAATAAIWVASVAAGNGASNNIIRNLELLTGIDPTTTGNATFGIIMCGVAVSTTSNGVDNDNNSFIANRIIKARYGIVTRGTTTDLNIAPIVTDNIVGPNAFGTDQISKVGIFMQADTGAIVSRNTVQFVGVLEPQAAAGSDRVGIAIGAEAWTVTSTTTLTSANYTVTKNIIHDIVEENTFSSVGLILGTTQGGGATNNLVANNMIYNIRANGTSGDQVCGIGIAGGNGDVIVNNSISISGDMDPGASTASATNGNAIRIPGANAANNANFLIQNNSIYLDASSSSTAALRFYAISLNSNTYVFGTGALNYNNYYINGANTQLQTGGLGTATGSTQTTQFATLVNWQAALTAPQDANSIQANPNYLSPISDLRIPGSSPNINAGTTVASVTDDFDGEVRPNGGIYDIGSDEYYALPGVLQLSSATYAGNEGTTLVVTVNRTGGSAGAVDVNYTLSDATATGTAACGVGTDYVNLGVQTLSFADGVTSLNINVSLCSDLVIDPAETFTIALSGPTGGATLGAISNATATIGDVPPPLNGTYTVGTAGNYPSLTNPGGIFDALNLSGASGNITIDIISDLAGETGAFGLNELVGGYTTLIQPSGAPRIVTGSVNGALIKINGADGVTINGSTAGATVATCLVGGNAALRELTIQNTNVGTAAAVISVQTGTNGAQNNTIKNVNVQGQDPLTTLIGISLGGNTPGTAGTDNDNNIVENCSVQKSIFGIYSAGLSLANQNLGTIIRQNDLSATGANRVRRVGMFLVNENGVNVSYNTVGGIDTSEAADAIGIALGVQNVVNTAVTAGGITNALVTNNKIDGASNDNTYSAAGIAVAGDVGGANTISNNMISNVISDGNSGDLVAGIFVAGVVGSDTRLYNNTVSLSGDRSALLTPGTAMYPSFAVAISGTDPIIDLRNNILVNSQFAAIGTNPNAKAYAAGTASTTFVNLNSNYNNYNSSGILVGGFRSGSLATAAGTDYATLALWAAAVADDANSVEIAPVFVSATDLHLIPASNVSLDNIGTLIVAVTTDFDCEVRSLTTPDMGADEFCIPTSNVTNVTACDTYTWAVNGATYTTGGTYNFVVGCHTETLNLTINVTPVADAPVNVTACDSYTLPALTVGNYFTGPGGTGTALSAGNNITSTQTIYVYAETGTTPNCTDENSFVVTINVTPVADAPVNVTACDSYTLPALTVGNYFTGAGGTGTALSAGNNITSTQTIYVYAETGTTPNCTDENSFVVTINVTPVADAPVNVTACDSYTLPALTVGNYFTGAGGTGTALSAGNNITSTQTIYVYAETGTTPNCTDENSFVVTINVTPVADAPVNVTACDSYTLPALTVGNYFTGAGGTGTALSAGNNITSTQTIYVYAETGTTPNCTDENSFVVTINVTPVADAPVNVTACDSYTLPALTVGNYFTGAGGTGTALSAGNNITSTQTIYVYAETGTTPNCTDENSFVVTINISPNADAPSDVSVCDSYTLPALTVGNYFTGAGGTGTALSAGNSITSTQTIYVYAETGTTPNCTDENSFIVTITSATISGSTTQVINGGVAADATIEDIVVTSNGTVTWFASSADATANVNPLPAGTVLVDGNIYYGVTNIGPCRSTTLAVTVTVVLGTSSFDLSQLNYYPNPVKDIFNVKYTKEIISVDVYDLTGRKVIEMKPNTLEVQLNMTNLSSAMYIVKLKSVDGITELKVYKN